MMGIVKEGSSGRPIKLSDFKEDPYLCLLCPVVAIAHVLCFPCLLLMVWEEYRDKRDEKRKKRENAMQTTHVL
jgi:hypothetical protein